MIIYFETQADYVNWLAGSVQTPRVVAYINSVHEYVYRTGDVSNSLVCREIRDINEENTLPYLYDEIISFDANLSSDQPGEENPDNPGTGENDDPVPDEPTPDDPVPEDPIYSGMIYEQDAPKTFTKDQLSKVYENFCIIGALLSKQDDTWTVWNTNPEEENYWDPKSDEATTPSEQYGEVVAVCLGRGLWAKIDWSGLTTKYKWAANNSDDLYNNYHVINIHGNGWESTKHILDVHPNCLYDTIWQQIKDGTTEDYDLYIPSKLELIEIFNNTCDGNHVDEQWHLDSFHTFDNNLCKLLNIGVITPGYWSSSQTTGSQPYYNFAERITFNSGASFGSNPKTTEWFSIALLHFN